MLPKNWYIEWKDKNIYESVNRHFNQSWIYVSDSFVNQDGRYYTSPPKGHTEITFEQFQMYVSKEIPAEPHYEIF